MKKYFLILIFLLLLSFTVFADNENKKTIDYSKYFDNLGEVKSQLNSNIQGLSGVAKNFIGNERVNINFTTQDKGIMQMHAIINNGQVETLEKENLKGSDLDIYIKEKDIDEIVNSDEPKKELKVKLENGEIKYKTHGFFKGLKLKIVKMFL